MSDSLWSHGLQHARLFCPSPSPGACSTSCPLSQWCHPLSSPSPPSIFPSIRVFLMSQFFKSGGQSTGASASASVLLEMTYHNLMIGAITCPPLDVSNLRYRDNKTVCTLSKVLASILLRPERKFETCLYFSEIYTVNSLDNSLKMTYFGHCFFAFIPKYFLNSVGFLLPDVNNTDTCL